MPSASKIPSEASMYLPVRLNAASEGANKAPLLMFSRMPEVFVISITRRRVSNRPVAYNFSSPVNVFRVLFTLESERTPPLDATAPSEPFAVPLGFGVVAFSTAERGARESEGSGSKLSTEIGLGDVERETTGVAVLDTTGECD